MTSANTWNRDGLPAWSYRSASLLDAEKEKVFLNHWHVVGHVNDLKQPGDWLSFDLLGERALVMRGQDGVIRSFHNTCRHRGSRLVEGDQGHCRGAIMCPFHAWVYTLEGDLKKVSQPEKFPDLDSNTWALKPLELEIWRGFLFLRFEPGPQSSIAEMMARHEDELSVYPLESLEPTDGLYTSPITPVNWKAMVDVDNECYHCPTAHPGLTDLYGRRYEEGPWINGTHRIRGPFNENPSRRELNQRYRELVEQHPDPFRSIPQAWLYIGLFPVSVLVFYPESAGFYRSIPLDVQTSVMTGATYKYDGESESMTFARKTSTAIDAEVMLEDKHVCELHYQATASKYWDHGLLGDSEKALREHHDMLRQLIPELNNPKSPGDSWH
ncbi:Benzoate 1 2-dioxygenase [Synechococcus sp. WH 8101]|uniref:aromatic ring-hydroxylating oxygenase subunit alpha n=1 Tax=Synechococcus sp. WH 8101 TaxID=59932 RepID=UPI001023DBD9|nr:aromatic ring-hydroxylating dioxygenase subunit alpha [Synechococcus sp. WH 8101]QBE69395.1 Benzoate 1 2-dioxygenase [Synechococcus sp. WH 8101]QNI45643.1 rieske [2Fe-2S] domain-containing protein [Synechococcus sp. WH 8101]